LLGITEFYRLGGAHAIAALAYGTAAIKRVDKIVGPGNLYVTAAKRLVAFDCAIDMLAGPRRLLSPANAATQMRSPMTLSRRLSTIPRRWPSSSLRALILRKRSSQKQSSAAATILLRARPSIATAWSYLHQASTKRVRSPIALPPSTSPSMLQLI